MHCQIPFVLIHDKSQLQGQLVIMLLFTGRAPAEGHGKVTRSQLQTCLGSFIHSQSPFVLIHDNSQLWG